MTVLRCDRFDVDGFLRSVANYPLFSYLGVEVSLEEAQRRFSLSIPYDERWKNSYDTMFGGVMLMTSDPFPAILMKHYFPGSTALTVRHSIEYLKPVRSKTTMRFVLSDQLLDAVEDALVNNSTSRGEFSYHFYDSRDRIVATVTSEYYLRLSAEARIANSSAK